MRSMKTLKQSLLERTRPGALWKPEKDDAVRCFACGHRCFIPKGFDGICKVRSNVKGELLVPWGYAGGIQVDPIEKKPFFHALPGRLALSFGMLGCDLHCSYCQNWVTSQALRDPLATARPQDVTPEALVTAAKRHGARVITSTYNEPLITSEWAVEIFKHARPEGLVTSYVSNGNATPEVLEYLRPWVDLYKIDLKGFDDKHYRQLGCVLRTVTDSIRRVHALGFWMEIVTLLIPGFNDGEDEIKKLCEFLVSVSPLIPWHATAYHPDYKMQEGATSLDTLFRAAEIGRAAGLKYVYLGNAPGRVGEWENTRCAGCGVTLIERRGFHIVKNLVGTSGSCPECHETIPGFWANPHSTDKDRDAAGREKNLE